HQDMSLKTAKVLILNAGFNFAHSGGKLNTSLTEEAKKYLESKGHEVKITNIADGYNIEEEVSKIMWSNVVILQTPGWWMGLPWGAKKYIDEVFAHGVMYRNDGRTRKDPSKKYGSGGLCQGRYIMISSTWNAPEESFDDPSQFLVSIPKSCTAALRASVHHLAVLTLYETSNVYFTTQP
ncbi:Modulator of drug activity B, putative, partial [Trichomonas vaginalis G3]